MQVADSLSKWCSLLRPIRDADTTAVTVSIDGADNVQCACMQVLGMTGESSLVCARSVTSSTCNSLRWERQLCTLIISIHKAA